MKKLLLLSRKKMTAITCALCAVLMLCVVNTPAFLTASAAQRQLPIYCVDRDQKMVSISFDAAWGNEDTQQLIDILGKYNVKATFFVVGEWVDKYPESVKALCDAGHEVMNHSDTHPHMSKLSRDQIITEVERCNDKIEAVTGVRPTLIRPPYGEYDDNVITAIRSLGMEPIQWDVEQKEMTSNLYAATDSWPGCHFHKSTKIDPEQRCSGPFFMGRQVKKSVICGGTSWLICKPPNRAAAGMYFPCTLRLEPEVQKENPK